jgi:hypothetical protein
MPSEGSIPVARTPPKLARSRSLKQRQDKGSRRGRFVLIGPVFRGKSGAIDPATDAKYSTPTLADFILNG